MFLYRHRNSKFLAKKKDPMPNDKNREPNFETKIHHYVQYSNLFSTNGCRLNSVYILFFRFSRSLYLRRLTAFSSL